MSWGAFFTLVAVALGAWFVGAIVAAVLIYRLAKWADDINDDE